MNSLLENPVGGAPEWSNFMTIDGDGNVTSIHHVPQEQFVHTSTHNGDCLCGPTVTANIVQGRDVLMVAHQPLDAVFYDEYGFKFDAGYVPCDDEDEDPTLP